MNYAQAVITGLVQGITEFLPISSSAHLAFTSAMYKHFTGQEFTASHTEEVFFDILLHVGTLIAVFIYFRKELTTLWKVLRKQKTDVPKQEEDFIKHLPLLITVGTISTLLIVWPFKDIFEEQMAYPGLVGGQLFITGIIIVVTEFIATRIKHPRHEMTLSDAFIIGLAQGVSVAPGISRSGSTIATALACGIDRLTAARYSFLLLIPIVILAALHHTVELYNVGRLQELSWGPIFAGTVVAAVSGYICVKYFVQFVSKYSLNYFAYYCFLVGAGMMFFFGL